MISLITMAFAAAPAPPADIPTVQLAPPLEAIMSARTLQKVKLPGSALVEFPGLPVEIGSYVDVWTRTPKGPCTVAQAVPVVLGPKGMGDLKHGETVLRVKPALVPQLEKLKYVGWTPRPADDPREYKEIACPLP